MARSYVDDLSGEGGKGMIRKRRGIPIYASSQLATESFEMKNAHRIHSNSKDSERSSTQNSIPDRSCVNQPS